MGCGSSSTRRVYPAQLQHSREAGSGELRPPPPRPVATISKATQTPPLSPQVESGMSDGGGRKLDEVILVQSFNCKQESVERDGHDEPGTHKQEQGEGQAKKDDEVKVEFTRQREEEEYDIEMIRIDQEEPEPRQVDVKTKIDSEKGIEKVKIVDDNVRDVESEVTKSEEKDESTLIVAEKASIIQNLSSVPSPDSKIETVTAGSEILDNKKVDDKPQTSKPDELIPMESSKDDDGEDPSNQELTKLNSSQHQQSNPLKPLPNFDDGITETKSEPRLPLLPPIGSKRIATLQCESGTLKSHSATGIVPNAAAVPKDQPKGESATSSKQSSSKKKKSTESLNTTSGSNTSKSKKSSSNGNGTASMGQKSKSRESLKLLGQQNRLTTTSKSTTSLATGAAKKLSISRESLKAASQVYSSVPTAKNGEALKKGDSGRSQSSKSKEAAKIEKDRKSSDQKQAEMAAGNDGNKAEEEMPENSSSEKNKSSDTANQDVTAKEKPGMEVSEATLPPTAVDEQTTAKSSDPPSTKKEDAKMIEVAVTVSEPEEKPDTNDQTDMKAIVSDPADKKVDTSDQTDVTGSSEDDETMKKDRESGGDTGEKSEEKEVKNKVSGETVKSEPTSTLDSVTQKEQVTSQDKNIDSNTEKPADEETNPRQESKNESHKPPASSKEQSSMIVEGNTEDTKAKDSTSDSTKPQKGAKEVVPKPQPKDVVELPAKHGSGEDTASQISSSEFASKLEIDKKTGQSEQSIVEAVEKSTAEPITVTKDITTPAGISLASH